MPALDMSQDYLVWDNPEPVLIERPRRVQPPADFTRADDRGDYDSVPVAKRRALTWKELTASGGAYTGQDLVWLLPQAVMPTGLAPRPGWVVIDDDNVRYTVLEVQLGKWRQTWRLVTRDLVLTEDLIDLIDIERAEVSYDAAGAQVRTFPPDGGKTIYRNLKARVQLATQEEADERGLRGLKGSYQIVVERDVLLADEDRIWWPGGKRYLDITRYTQPDRIDQLPVIEAEFPL